MKEFKPFELLLMPYGLEQSAPTMTVRYPDRLVDDGGLRELTWDYSEARPMAMPIDHFTCHRDGTIHLKKRRNAGPLYAETVKCDEPITANSSRFFDAFILSDRAAAYGRVSPKAKHPRIALVANPDEVVSSAHASPDWSTT